jgi:glycosyltransferase involved in cell wall biosynthesis
VRILIALTYYRPHVSGLTIYTERVARALARRGHQVTVLTSRFDRHLPAREVRDGVEIVRPWVMARVSKGVLMPTVSWWATQLVRSHDVVSIHLPQFDAPGIALRGRLFRKPTVLTYHCDLSLPPTLFNRMANQVIHLANHLAASASHVIVAYTRDYAENSPFLARYLGKVTVIPPPVEVAEVKEEEVKRFRARLGLTNERAIGMAARLATEKGVEYLVEALPVVLERYPDLRVLFAGEHRNVIGERAYARRLSSSIEQLGAHWDFLGVLDPRAMATFFRACDMTVLPSINSTESFGLVQVESMLCGRPVVASALPGVRQPVRTTGMGRIVPARDAKALAEAVLEVLDHPESYRTPLQDLRAIYSPDAIARQYEQVFLELQKRMSRDRSRHAAPSLKG